jgi:hypothetical protein
VGHWDILANGRIYFAFWGGVISTGYSRGTIYERMKWNFIAMRAYDEVAEALGIWESVSMNLILHIWKARHRIFRWADDIGAFLRIIQAPPPQLLNLNQEFEHLIFCAFKSLASL